MQAGFVEEKARQKNREWSQRVRWKTSSTWSMRKAPGSGLLCLIHLWRLSQNTMAGWLQQQALLSHSSGGSKSAIRVLALSGSSKSPISRVVEGPLLHTSSQELASVHACGERSLSLYKTSNPIIKALPS